MASWKPRSSKSHQGPTQSYLPQRLTQLAEDALLIEHLALVAVLIVLVDALPCVSWQLVEGHVLLHLLVLEGQPTASRQEDTEADVGQNSGGRCKWWEVTDVDQTQKSETWRQRETYRATEGHVDDGGHREDTKHSHRQRRGPRTGI